MVLVRMRIDEMVSAWVGDVDTPFQLGLLGVFEAGPWLRPDGTVDLSGLRAELATRARGVPELRRRPVWTHVGEGRPVWAEDPSFDPLRHIRLTTSATGDDILAWAANRSVHPLELDRPLWCAELVGGLTGGRFAVLLVVHHVLADGLAGVRILGSLFDASSDAVLPGAPPVVAGRLPTHLDLVRDRIAGRRAHHRRSRRPDRAHGRRRPMRGFRRAMEGFRTPLPTTSLPRHVGPARRLVASSRPLESVRRTGHVLGATVNDLVLAAVTEGLRDLLAGRGELTEGLFLRATVPVATGRAGQAMGMLVVDLPVGEPDPGRRLSPDHGRDPGRQGRPARHRGRRHRPPPRAVAGAAGRRALGSARRQQPDQPVGEQRDRPACTTVARRGADGRRGPGRTPGATRPAQCRRDLLCRLALGRGQRRRLHRRPP